MFHRDTGQHATDDARPTKLPSEDQPRFSAQDILMSKDRLPNGLKQGETARANQTLTEIIFAERMAETAGSADGLTVAGTGN